MSARRLKPRTCKADGCSTVFDPWSSLQTACSTPCAIAMASSKAEKKAERERRKQAMQTKRERIAAKKAFNESDKDWCLKRAKEELHRWIVHVRDAGKPCISCGNANPNIKYDAGHFLSVGAYKNLEMEPRNIHKQCSLNCNQHLSSNRAGYEAGLVDRYGQDELDWLLGPHDAKHYKASDYLAIRDKYRELNRAAGVLPYQKARQ